MTARSLGDSVSLDDAGTLALGRIRLGNAYRAPRDNRKSCDSALVPFRDSPALQRLDRIENSALQTALCWQQMWCSCFLLRRGLRLSGFGLFRLRISDFGVGRTSGGAVRRRAAVAAAGGLLTERRPQLDDFAGGNRETP